jgi:hypothetical protein
VESSASIKLTLSTKVELWVSVWLHSTPEKFIVHVKQAIMAIKAKGLQEAYEKLFGLRRFAPRRLRKRY